MAIVTFRGKCRISAISRTKLLVTIVIPFSLVNYCLRCKSYILDVAWIYHHVHIISYRFLLRFAKLYGMMWTHFPSIFMSSMSLKTLNIILICFEGKNNYLKKNKTRESTAIVITKACRKYWKLISFWLMMKYSFFIHWLIQILVVITVGSHY